VGGSRETGRIFEVIPSIDVLEGRCVRLAQGSYADVTVYEPDPARAARRWAAHPIRRFHVVDLDGARDGVRRNEASIRAIVAAMGSVPVQLGGGVRSVADAEAALALGVDRVVMGTVALKQPQVVRDAARAFPGRVVLGLDARDGRVAVEGWRDVSEMTAVELAQRFAGDGIAAIVYTDIARDGMLAGANLDATAALAECVDVPVIVSGGVASLADIEGGIARMKSGIAGAILGRSLYTGAVDLAEALAAAERAAEGAPSCC
jgi:phosphoribosylformimino-5-aminoimidazole carboxamide ribotide isomerase